METSLLEDILTHTAHSMAVYLEDNPQTPYQTKASLLAAMVSCYSARAILASKEEATPDACRDVLFSLIGIVKSFDNPQELLRKLRVVNN